MVVVVVVCVGGDVCVWITGWMCDVYGGGGGGRAGDVCVCVDHWMDV